MGKAVEFLNPEERGRIASECFAVDRKTSSPGEIRGRCPFHDEKNPSFSYAPEKDLFHCLACGESGDLIKLWANAQGITDSKEGFGAFCKKFKPDETETEALPTSGELEEAWDRFPALPQSMVEKLVRERRWSEDAIRSLDLRLQTLRWNRRVGAFMPESNPCRIAMVVRDAKGQIRNIRSYLPGAKEFKLISAARGLGQSRLWPEPSKWKDGPIWLLEGEPDVVCGWSHGLNAVTQTAGAGFWKRSFSKFFEDRDVVVAYDADGKGIRGAEMVAGHLAKVARSVRILRWPDFMGKQNGSWPEDHGQDLTDWFARHRRSLQELEELLIEATRVKSTRGKLESLERFMGTDGNFKSALLAREMMEEMELVSDPLSGLIYKWNGQFWEEINLAYIRRRALLLLGEEATTSRVTDVVSQIRDLSTLPQGSGMDPFPHVLCLQNGMLDLNTYDLMPHKREFYATHMLGVPFLPKATCDRWLRFLEETIQDEHSIRVAQEWAGYCLTQEVFMEKALLLYGRGSDGKSKFISILQALVGEKNCSAVNMTDLEDQFYRATLFGKLLNTSTETEGKAFTSGFFKAIVSGDMISAAFKNKDPFEFKPRCKLVFACNRWLRVLDNTDGFYRRLLTIAFKKQFKGADRDLHLQEKLMAELPGIFAWALVGLDRLRRQKDFTDSADMRRTLMEYRYENNPVLGFVSDCCRVAPVYEGESMEVSQIALYDKYREFCGKCGFGPMNLNHFTRELKIVVPSLMVSRRRSGLSRERVYKGVVHDPN